MGRTIGQTVIEQSHLAVPSEAIGNVSRLSPHESVDNLDSSTSAVYPIAKTSSIGKMRPGVMIQTKTESLASSNSSVTLIQDEVSTLLDQHLGLPHEKAYTSKIEAKVTRNEPVYAPVSESMPDSKFMDWCEVPILGNQEPLKTYSSGSIFSSTEKAH